MGKISPPFIILGVVAIIAILLGTVSYFNTYQEHTITFSVNPSLKVGDAIDKSEFNFASFVIGSIPQSLIDSVGAGSAVVIIFAIFLMLLLSFGDIVNAFGTFGNEYTGWILGSLLAIVAANLKVVMLVSVWLFGITAGLGALSVAFAVAIPFVIFLGIQFGSKKLANFSRKRMDAMKVAVGTEKIRAGMRTAAAMGDEAKDASKKS